MAITIKNKRTEESIYTAFSIAIVYSMLFLTYLNSVLSILLAVFWLLFSKKTLDISSKKTKLVLLFISLYLIGVVGLSYSSNVTAGIKTLETQSAILIFPLIFGTIPAFSSSFIKRVTDHVLVATSIAAIVSLVVGIYNYSKTGSSDSMTGDRILIFHALRPATMGLFCLTSIIIAIEKIKTTSGKMKLLLLGCVALMTLIIFLLSIRLIIVCWLVLILFFVFTMLSTWRSKLILFTTCLMVFGIASFTIPTVKNQWTELFDPSQSTIILDKDSSLGRSWGGKALRVAIWTCSFDIVKKHWITGVGTGDVQDSLQKAYENRKFYFASMYNRYNAHNQYLQMLLATGIPGLSILIGCILYPLWNYRKLFAGNIYVLFLLLFAVICFTESILEVNKGIIWYSFLNSIFAFGYLKSDKT